jgi:hypothetical protein
MTICEIVKLPQVMNGWRIHRDQRHILFFSVSGKIMADPNGNYPHPHSLCLEDLVAEDWQLESHAPEPRDSEPKASSTGEDGRSQEEAADGGKAVMEEAND